MKQTDKDGLIASVALLLIALIIGASIGYISRGITTDNKAKMAKFERDLAEKEFYEARTAILKAYYLSGKGKEVIITDVKFRNISSWH